MRAALVVEHGPGMSADDRVLQAQLAGLVPALDTHGVQADILDLDLDPPASVPAVPAAYEVIHAHGWRAGHHVLSTRTPGRPVVVSLHDLASLTPLHSHHHRPTVQRLAAEHAIRAQADHLLADTSEELFELLSLGASAASVSVIPPAVDLSRFCPGAATKAPLQPVVLALGTLDPWLAEALPAVLAAADARLVTCTLEEDPDRRLAALRRSDVAVCSDGALAGAVAALEAMASGVPVIAAKAGALADVVVDGVTGHLVEPGHADQLADAMASTLRDAANRVRLGSAARDRAEARFGFDRSAERTGELYHDLVHSPAGAVSTTSR